MATAEDMPVTLYPVYTPPETWKSADIDKLAAALSKAQGVIENASKNSENPFFKSKYADLAEVWKVAREPLSANGLAVVQLTNDGPQDINIETVLTHASGQWMKSSLTVRPTKADPQGIGSAITYGRRYAFAAIVGITQEDDDANEASKPAGKAPAKKAVAATQPPAKPAAPVDPAIISEPQRKRLYAIASKREGETGISAKDLCQEAMETECDPVPEKTSGILKSDYEAVVAFVETCDADNFGVPQ